MYIYKERKSGTHMPIPVVGRRWRRVLGSPRRPSLRLLQWREMSDLEGVVVSDGDLQLRMMLDTADDYAQIVRWRNQPHVHEWWDPDEPPMTLDVAVSECRPAITGAEPDRLAFIELGETAVGFVQFYPWIAYTDELVELGLSVPDGAWGLDIYVGEPKYVNRGIGTRTVRLLCDYLCAHEGASGVALGVERGNARARRAYEKAGMRPSMEYLDTDTRSGERVWSVLMVRMCHPQLR
jgi:aminoglycoside 6'-N-acetyltransferase